jgi:YHS domain-containing protein
MLKKLFIMLAMVSVIGGFSVTGFAESPPDSKEVATCPVTGERVADPSKAPKSEYKGKTYYFCCPACKPKFDADPEKYLKKSK